MAKKSVGVVELHIEKVILGAAVIFLLVVLVMNLVRNPNVVEFNGETYTPSQIDNEIRIMAQDLARDLQRTAEVAGDRLEAPAWAGQLGRTFKEGQVRLHGLSDTIVAAVPWGEPAEQIEVETVQRRKEGVALVRVLPPSAPKVRYIRTLAILPRDPNAKEEQDQTQPLEEDIDLVIVESEFDLARQKELIEKSQYQTEFSTITFALVQVQRQELLGSEWSEWEDVAAVTAYPPPTPPVLKQIGEEGLLSSDSLREFNEYRDRLMATNVQSDILTPQGPTLRSGGPADGQPRDRAVRTRTDRDRRGGGLQLNAVRLAMGDRDRNAVRGGDYRDVYGERGTRKPTAKDDDKKKDEKDKLKFNTKEQAQRFIEQTLAKAEKAQAAQQYDQAKELAQQVLDARRLNRGAARSEQVRKAEKILGGGVDSKTRDLGARTTGGRYQAIRAFDVSGVPGRTYRYRERVAILNDYCLAAGKLKDPRDATKAIIVGEWSVPSEPVSIEQDTYFYLVGKDYAGEGVRVAVFKWYRDGWIKQDFEVQPGYEIGGKRDVEVTIAGEPYLEKVDFFAGAMAVDTRFDVPYESLQQQGKGWRLNPSVTKTESLVYMDDDGEVQVRFAAEDKLDVRYKKLLDQTKTKRVKVKDTKKDKTKDKKIKKSSKTSRRRYGRGSSRYGGRGSSRSGSRGRSRGGRR